MTKHSSFNPGLLRLAGIAGILAGLFILSFAIMSDSHGILFSNEIFAGASAEQWIRNVQASPGLSKFIMAFPVFGFSCMLIVATVLYQYIKENSWQKNLSLAGYVIGVPFVVGVFASHLGLVNEVLLLYGKSPETNAQIQLQAFRGLYNFQLANHIFGPFFIIILGTAMMAWAALKSGTLPKWLCYWAIGCGALIFISFFSFFIPILKIAGLAAPLHMLWFIVLGVVLWKRSLV